MKQPTVFRQSRRAAIERSLLRLFDILLAVSVLVILSPLLLLALPGTRWVQTPMRGRHGRLFGLLSLVVPTGKRGLVLRVMGVDTLPLVLNILAGDMAWVGPRALRPTETVPEPFATARLAVKPGLFSLWRLRQLTLIDFASEWETDLEQIQGQSFGGDIALLLRNLLASFYGKPVTAAGDSPLLIDTLRVSSVTLDDTLALIERKLAAPAQDFLQLCFVNPDCVNIARRNARYRNIVNRAGLVVPDGIGMRIAGNILQTPFRQNVNGTDLFPRLCARLAGSGARLFLLGGQPGVAAATAGWIAQHYPHLAIAGTHHGYYDKAAEAEVLADIRASKADVLLVAMGAPQQEIWIDQHGRDCGVQVAMGVGGLFDFYAGRIPRAPLWLRELGLEWSWRLYQEPARLWRRYLVGNVSFLLAVWLQRWLGSLDMRQLAAEPTAPPTGQSSRRALVLVTSASSTDWPLQSDMTPVLLPLGDRPLLYRTMESLAGLGCHQVDVFASQELSGIRSLLGSGERWGLQIKLHGVRDDDDGWRRMALTPLASDEQVWVHRADHWLPAAALKDAAHDVLWCQADEHGKLQWSGWARSGRRNLANCLASCRNNEPAAAALSTLLAAPLHDSPYRYDSAVAMLAAQQRWLTRPAGRFELLAEQGAGIRVAASARIEAGAVLTAPVEIGDGAFVAASARVGPFVVLGTGTRIEAGVTIENSLVADGVCLKGAMQIGAAVVTGAGLYHCAHRVWLPAGCTGNLLAPAAAPAPAAVDLTERLLALLMLAAAALPVLLLKMAGLAGDFAQRVYPQLPAVLRGRRALIGVGNPATIPESIKAAGWSEQLQQAPQGLITPREALAVRDPDAAAWADVHWLLHHSWPQRLRLLRAYMRSVCLS